ncbi:MAG: HD family phosphohydrolase [Gemmatimonadales bacterium]
MIGDRHETLWELVRYHGTRWLPVAVLALLTYFLFPVTQDFDLPILDSGDVATVDVLAPFDFEVRKSEEELEREADVFASTVRPIYEVRTTVPDSLEQVARDLFARLDSVARLDSGDGGLATEMRLSDDQFAYLTEGNRPAQFRRAVLRMIGERLSRGVAASGVLESESSPELMVRVGDTERIIPRDSTLSMRRYLDSRRDFHPDPNSSMGDDIFIRLLSRLFRATLLPNTAETDQARTEARALVDSIKYTVRRDERIITAHELVTDAGREKLVGLRQELLRRGGVSGSSATAVLGQVLTNALMVSIFWFLLTFYRRESYAEMRQVVVLAVLFGIVIVGAALIYRLVGDRAEFIPIPMAAMLITVLFSGRAALLASVALAILLGSQTAYAGQDAIYIALVGGIAAAFSVRSIQRRTQMLVAFMVVTGGFALAALTVGLRFNWTLAEFATSFGLGATNAFASAALVILTLPIFETASGVTTDLTLLELSDPNRPLMRRLATEAQGTYAHSIAMANLCESACNAIGANGLLARVGCYYHDIGKLTMPRFFAENQVGGHNPHDTLTPGASAEIIRKHVLDGITLAEEHGLPDSIKSFIPEHHGTLEITYFLERAKQQSNGNDPDPELFRYPGPVPRSAETAVTMLADSIEAALRVLEDPTPDKLADAIDHIVTQRIESGQLAEAPLTLRQIEVVKREFLRVLSGMYHTRIEYPEEGGGITANWDGNG